MILYSHSLDNFSGGLYNLGGVFPVWTLILLVGAILAIVVACTSRNEKPPIYHCVRPTIVQRPLRIEDCAIGFFVFFFSQIFAWVGFAVAVVWIYSIANEIVNLLQVWFGFGFPLSPLSGTHYSALYLFLGLWGRDQTL